MSNNTKASTESIQFSPEMPAVLNVDVEDAGDVVVTHKDFDEKRTWSIDPRGSGIRRCLSPGKGCVKDKTEVHGSNSKTR